jgi:hypothetical protein
MHRIRVNFAKDYQKDSYNKSHLMGKKFKDKDLLFRTLKVLYHIEIG